MPINDSSDPSDRATVSDEPIELQAATAEPDEAAQQDDEPSSNGNGSPKRPLNPIRQATDALANAIEQAMRDQLATVVHHDRQLARVQTALGEHQEKTHTRLAQLEQCLASLTFEQHTLVEQQQTILKQQSQASDLLTASSKRQAEDQARLEVVSQTVNTILDNQKSGSVRYQEIMTALGELRTKQAEESQRQWEWVGQVDKRINNLKSGMVGLTLGVLGLMALAAIIALAS